MGIEDGFMFSVLGNWVEDIEESQIEGKEKDRYLVLLRLSWLSR